MADNTTNGAEDFTPARIPTESELAAFDHRNVPSPIEVIGDVKINVEPVLSSLSPEMQARVNAKMATVRADHAIFEKQFINEELEDNSYRLKVLAGPGKDANEYERECFGLAREMYDLEREEQRIQADLDATVGFTTAYDDNGNPVAEPIYQFAAETRRGRADALQDVRYRIAQLEREAPARRSAAAGRVQQLIAANNEQMAIHQEAKAQANATLRRERVDALANAFASNRRHNIG